ncbi:zinc finger SWIM domain-containing protein 3 [Biomphalaria pfeifferi]|uniref:Zinc finger SWIM domain-containing protein 3 n=1 Tax=Biomphalaria pfeifferi TaxID=112525 RepID=A0AAD8BHY6_BIOPF|nr:zinc finger SWIM domain-containing protein 3 [Biomphalaria pfeifferi]
MSGSKTSKSQETDKKGDKIDIDRIEPALRIEIIKRIELNAEFDSFLELRDAIDRYQKENSVQLIVKDSKLLKAESTRKIMPKVYHLVNQSLMYHSIIYCCKCHGELKQKPNTRIKNAGQKRLNCPMYIRFKLTPDLQKLTLFDMYETHNHSKDTNTIQMTPRQQVYKISKMKRKRTTNDNDGNNDREDEKQRENTVSQEDETKKEVLPEKLPRRSARMKARFDNDDLIKEEEYISDCKVTFEKEVQHSHLSDSPLDSDSETSDSDEEEIRKHRQLLPFPIRLIGSAIKSSPELLMSTKQLIEIQKSNLLLEKQKLILETKHLELANAKLELEVRILRKNLAVELASSSNTRDRTIYLQS